MTHIKDRTNGDHCICCNRVNVDGTWREAAEIDPKLIPLELKGSICPNCTFEKFPNFYVGDRFSTDKRTKKVALKLFSFIKGIVSQQRHFI